MNLSVTNRWSAGGLHLLISIVLIAGLAITALLLWYPYGTYAISGLQRLLVLMLIVDISIGPLLTLVVYKPRKPSLKMDLSVIAVLQLAFLSYGLHTLWQSRPVFIVATSTQYNLVFANEISDSDRTEATQPQWRKVSFGPPQLVGAELPSDPAERERLLFSSISTGVDIERLPKYYVNFDKIAPQLLKKAQQTQVQGKPLSVDIVSRYDSSVMQIDPKSARPVRLMP